MIKGAEVFVANELRPLQARIEALNERVGERVVRFNRSTARRKYAPVACIRNDTPIGSIRHSLHHERHRVVKQGAAQVDQAS